MIHIHSRTSSSKGKSTAPTTQVEDDDEDAVYLEDLDPSIPVGQPRSGTKPQSSTKPKFYDHDPYRLPEMDFDSTIAEASRSALDPRLATIEEMHSFISEMAPSDFDLTSEAFRSLPTEVQYEIIGDLRLRSRQTSFKRLQNMLKNSETPLDFSKEQIKGLKERNRLTQQLLTTTDSMGKAHVEIPIRIAGERNREYVLVKNEGDGKGWILGMRDVGTRDQPIVVDDPARDGVKPKEARDKEREKAESDDDVDMEEVDVLMFDVPHNHEVPRLIPAFSRPGKQPSPTSTVPQDQDLRKYKAGMALEAVAKRQKPFSRPYPVKSGSGIFPRRPSGSKSRTESAKVPLFVPDEEDDAIPQVVGESEGDDWEDFDGGLEEDVQMSIAIAESLESQDKSRRISDPRPLAETPILGTPLKPPRQTGLGNNDRTAIDDEDEFTSPSRLATQLSIAGARRPLSARIPSDSVRGTTIFATSNPSISPKKPTYSSVANPVLDQPTTNLTEGGTGDRSESGEDDDMEEVSIPEPKENRLRTPDTEPALKSPFMNPDQTPVTNPVGTPLAIGVEDAVAKRFAEFQKIFEEKRKAFRAENPQLQEDVGLVREVPRTESPGLEYVDDEVEVIDAQVRGEGAVEVSSPSHPRSDEDEDMEEVEVVSAPPSVPSHVPLSVSRSESARSFKPPTVFTPAIGETPNVQPTEESVDEEDEEVRISDWSRSPSPRPRPPGDEAGPSTSGIALDRSRGLLDPDDSFDQGPPGEQDQEQEAFDAAHEMDPDAEAGEFARWMSQVKGRDLDDVRKEIEQEINGLRKERKAAMRDSEDITGQMIAQIMVRFRHPCYQPSPPF